MRIINSLKEAPHELRLRLNKIEKMKQDAEKKETLEIQRRQEEDRKAKLRRIAEDEKKYAFFLFVSTLVSCTDLNLDLSSYVWNLHFFNCYLSSLLPCIIFVFLRAKLDEQKRAKAKEKMLKQQEEQEKKAKMLTVLGIDPSTAANISNPEVFATGLLQWCYSLYFRRSLSNSSRIYKKQRKTKKPNWLLLPRNCILIISLFCSHSL